MKLRVLVTALLLILDAFANLTPLQGVTFTAQKINQYDGKDVDLSKESGWDARWLQV